MIFEHDGHEHEVEVRWSRARRCQDVIVDGVVYPVNCQTLQAENPEEPWSDLLELITATACAGDLEPVP